LDHRKVAELSSRAVVVVAVVTAVSSEVAVVSGAVVFVFLM